MALSAMRSPVSGNFNLVDLIPTQLERYSAMLGKRVSDLVARITGSKNPHIELSAEEKSLLTQLKARCQVLSKCAQSLNPRFTRPFQLKVSDGPTGTHGGNVIYLSKADLQRPLHILHTLTPYQKHSLLTAIIAHEIGHCILRHRLRTRAAITTGIACWSILGRTSKALYFKYALPYLTRRFTTLSPKTINRVALSMLLPAMIKVSLWAHRMYCSLSRKHEVEADATSALLVAKYNKSCPSTKRIADIALFVGWKQKVLEVLNSPFLANLPSTRKTLIQLQLTQPHPLDTHPTDMQREKIGHRATLMLRKHPEILTNLSKRHDFFAELQQDRPANDPTFMKKWDISEKDTTLEALGIITH